MSYSQCQTQNTRGEWVPAIPVPYHASLHREKCRCGACFWTLRGYLGHYAYAHILGMEET